MFSNKKISSAFIDQVQYNRQREKLKETPILPQRRLRFLLKTAMESGRHITQKEIGAHKKVVSRACFGAMRWAVEARVCIRRF